MKYTAHELAAHFAQRCAKAKETRDGWMACCPAHDDSTPSLHITPADDCILLHCFAGCSKTAIVAALSLTRDDLAVSAHRRELPVPGPHVQSPKAPRVIPDAPARRERLIQIWRQARSITPGDPVGRYLTRRGLWHEPIPKTLRYHPHLDYWDNGIVSYHPALIAAIQAPSDTVVTLHRIYLATNGEKAAVPKPKKLLPPTTPWHSAAVRLDRAGTQLIVSEGIESGLAVRRSTGYPTWAAISAGGLKALVVPPVVELVVIAADHDRNGIGQQAARTLANRLIHEGRRVKIVMPDTPGTDWADSVQEVYGA